MIDQKFLFEQGRTEEDGERDRRKPRKEKEKSIRIWEKRSLQIMWPIEGSRKRSKGGKVQILKKAAAGGFEKKKNWAGNTEKLKKARPGQEEKCVFTLWLINWMLFYVIICSYCWFFLIVCFHHIPTSLSFSSSSRDFKKGSGMVDLILMRHNTIKDIV